MLADYTRRRQFLLQRVSRIPGWRCVPPQGTFYVFANIGGWIGRTLDGRTIADSADFSDSLAAAAGVRVIPGTAFGAPHHIRLSFAASLAAIEEGMDRIEQWLGK
jgi:aspartate aminotransferase